MLPLLWPERAVPEVEGEAGTLTVSAGRNMLAWAWNVPGKKERIEDTQHKTLNTSHNGTAWGPKTKWFLVSCNQTLYFRCWYENQSIYWDLQDNKECKILKGHPDFINLVFHHKESYEVIGLSDEHTFRVWGLKWKQRGHFFLISWDEYWNT